MTAAGARKSELSASEPPGGGGGGGGGEGPQQEGAAPPRPTARPGRGSPSYGPRHPRLATLRPRPRIEQLSERETSPDLEPRGRGEITRASSSATSDSSSVPVRDLLLEREKIPTNSTTRSSAQGGRGKRKRGRPLASSRRTRTRPSSTPSIDPSPSLELDMGTSSASASAAHGVTQHKNQLSLVETGTESSAYSSPLRRPVMPIVTKIHPDGTVTRDWDSDQEVVDAFHRDYYKYREEQKCLEKLPTMRPIQHYANITDWHDLKQKNTVLNVAKSVLSFSASHDGKDINCCSGIIIDWDDIDKTAIVVTSSRIICTEISLDDWEDNNVYAPSAKVIAQLFDGSTSEVQLLYFSKHYDIAFFKVVGVSGVKAASLVPKVQFGEEACVLARDEEMNLICQRTTVRALDPCDHQKNHYLFISGKITPKCGDGAALTNFDGNIVGMTVNAVPNFAFIPSLLILKCLKLWRKFGRVARPHLGLKLRTVNFMDISHLDHLSRSFNIDSGLIVAKVSFQSSAERNGIRVGDVIFSCEGNTVSTISQWEDILLDVFEKQFERGDNPSSEVDVEVGVCNLGKRTKSTVILTGEISDCMEVVK